MDQTQFSTTIQGFQLQISTKDSHLYLHAEHLQDHQEFHLELDNISIVQRTNHLFTDAQSMAQALKDATNNASPDCQLSFDDLGRLTYSARTPQERFSFSFDLIEDRYTQTAFSLQRKAEALEKELGNVKVQHSQELINMKLEYEERIRKLEQIILQEKEKNVKIQAVFEAEVARIQHNERASHRSTMDQVDLGQIWFRRDTLSADLFEFTDDDKTAKLVEWGDQRSLKCYPLVPETGKHTFALKVNQIGEFIGFGITAKKSDEIYQGDEGCYFYFIKDGMLLMEGFQTSDKIEGAGDKDSIVEMTVDMDARALMFIVDGKQVRSCKLKEGEKGYSVFVWLTSIRNSVTLL